MAQHAAEGKKSFLPSYFLITEHIIIHFLHILDWLISKNICHTDDKHTVSSSSGQSPSLIIIVKHYGFTRFDHVSPEIASQKGCKAIGVAKQSQWNLHGL